MSNSTCLMYGFVENVRVSYQNEAEHHLYLGEV
jgi:hypothetical protein